MIAKLLMEEPRRQTKLQANLETFADELNISDEPNRLLRTIRPVINVTCSRLVLKLTLND